MSNYCFKVGGLEWDFFFFSAEEYRDNKMCVHVCFEVPWQQGTWLPPSSVQHYRLFLRQHSGWAGNQLAVWSWLFPADQHLNRATKQPQTNAKLPFTLVRWSLWRECQERSLWRNTIKMPRLISASVSKTAQNHIRWRRGSAGRRVCTPHATPSVKLKSKWQDTVQISMNNAMMLKNG